MTSLPSSRNLSAKARPIPAEPPVMRMVRFLRFIIVLSSICHEIICILQWLQKKRTKKQNSKAVQKVISHTCQHLLPISGIAKNTGNGHGSCHCTENDKEVSFPLCCGCSWHEFHPIPHQTGTPFSDIQLSASDL